MSDIVDRLRADARRVENPHLYETQSLELYAADEIERLRSRLAEETAIVDRIWDIYGRPTYEQLAGRSIYDLINADLARLAEVERLLQEVYDGRQSLMSVGLVYRIGHTLNHRTPDSASD